MDIKLIATDVDGTLVAGDHMEIPKVNIEALRMAKEKGLTIVISTGRSLSLAAGEIEKLGCVDYAIISNGAAVVDLKNNKVIYSCYMEKEKVKEIVNIFNKYSLVYEIYADGKGFISQYTYDNFRKCVLPNEFMDYYRTKMELYADPMDVAENTNVEKFNVDYTPEESIEALNKDLEKVSDVVITAGFPGNVEITAVGADKGKALKWLCDELKIDMENVMALGDSGNDVTMLQEAGESYAMISGNELAKKAAKHITKLSNNDGGVGETIKEYLTNTEK